MDRKRFWVVVDRVRGRFQTYFEHDRKVRPDKAHELRCILRAEYSDRLYRVRRDQLTFYGEVGCYGDPRGHADVWYTYGDLVFDVLYTAGVDVTPGEDEVPTRILRILKRVFARENRRIFKTSLDPRESTVVIEMAPDPGDSKSRSILSRIRRSIRNAVAI
jgi:hypothetical protein